MTITVSTTEKRDGKALALFARHDTWMRGHTRDGRSFFAIPGSTAGLFHMADQNDCSCFDRQRSRNVCKHQRAVRLWMAAFMTGAVAPKPRPSADCSDDRIILTPLGAAALVELDSEPKTAAVTATEHPQVAQLREMLTRETCPEDRQAIEAKLHDTQAKIAATAARGATYSALFGEDDDKPYCTPCRRHHEVGEHYSAHVA